MKSVSEAIEALVRLDLRDRDWIISQLTASQKSRLVMRLGGDLPLREPGPAAIPTVPVQDGGLLDDAAPFAIVHELKKEPAWIIHAVLRVRQWKWEEAVLAALPAAVRLEIAHLDRTGLKLAPAVTDSLIRALAECSHTVHFNAPTRGTPSRLSAWFDARRARVRQWVRA